MPTGRTRISSRRREEHGDARNHKVNRKTCTGGSKREEDWRPARAVCEPGIPERGFRDRRYLPTRQTLDWSNGRGIGSAPGRTLSGVLRGKAPTDHRDHAGNGRTRQVREQRVPSDQGQLHQHNRKYRSARTRGRRRKGGGGHRAGPENRSPVLESGAWIWGELFPQGPPSPDCVQPRAGLRPETPGSGGRGQRGTGRQSRGTFRTPPRVPPGQARHRPGPRVQERHGRHPGSRLDPRHRTPQAERGGSDRARSDCDPQRTATPGGQRRVRRRFRVRNPGCRLLYHHDGMG